MRIGNSVINPKLLRSARMIENEDWLGISDGYAIRCELTDGRKIDILDEDDRGFSYLEADDIMDEIDEALGE